MKRTLLLATVLLCAAWGATTIRWTDIKTREGVQLGLRSDGVVVWREITTNSPSEAPKLHYGSILIDLSGTNSYTPGWGTVTNYTFK